MSSSSMSKGLHQRITWFVLCAVFFVAIVPSISHFFASNSQSKIWVELCSSYGTKRVALDFESAQDSDPSPSHLTSSASHCPFCRLQNDLPVIPTSVSLLTFAPSFDAAVPESIASPLPRSRFIRTAHLTRAPPAIS